MGLHELIKKAADFKKGGNKTDALKTYSEAFDILVKESTTYADGFENTGHEIVEDGKKIWVEMPAFFNKAEEYMKRDITAATISNNMGVLLAELGDAKNAKEWLKQAIELTPNDTDYPEPKINLKALE